MDVFEIVFWVLLLSWVLSRFINWNGSAKSPAETKSEAPAGRRDAPRRVSTRAGNDLSAEDAIREIEAHLSGSAVQGRTPSPLITRPKETASRESNADNIPVPQVEDVDQVVNTPGPGSKRSAIDRLKDPRSRREVFLLKELLDPPVSRRPHRRLW